MKHKIQINVAKLDGKQQKVLGCRRSRVPSRLMSLLFGGFSEVIILSPGMSVHGVEIHEVREKERNE